MAVKSLAEQAVPFLNYVDGWLASRPALPLAKVVTDPARTAIVSVDITNGFCFEGALASPRVASIVEPAVRLFKRAWACGVRNIVLAQDTHEPDAIEFSQYPPHCVRGTSEAQPVTTFQQLPFFPQMVITEKNSIQPFLNTGLAEWVNQHTEIDTFIVIGDCTDICTYQLAMHLRTDANAHQMNRRVIVPVDCVQTYDRPVEVAQQQGGLPHDGNLLHAVFLYHMQLNGVEVVSEIS